MQVNDSQFSTNNSHLLLYQPLTITLDPTSHRLTLSFVQWHVSHILRFHRAHSFDDTGEHSA